MATERKVIQEQEKRDLAPSERTYDFFVKARNGRKRDFIFSYGKARTCPHRNLVTTAVGGNTYRCTECNYFYTIVAAYVEPMHLATVKAAYQLLHYAKEFGLPALQETLRQPHGQSDGTPHKGVIPDGMNMGDVLAAMDGINVLGPDRGAAELKALVESVWPSEAEFQRRIEALHGSDLSEKQKYAAELEEKRDGRNAIVAATRRKARAKFGPSHDTSVPALPKAKG